MATPPIVTQYGGPTPYKLTNIEANINLFYSNIPFYPNQLSNLAIWLDGKDILNNGSNNPADGTPVDGWANKAPNSIFVKQDTSAYRPVYYSATGVNFSNANDKTTINGLDTTYSSENKYETVFILLNITAIKSNYNLLYPTLTDGRQLYLLSNTLTQTTLTTAKRPENNLLESGIVLVREAPRTTLVSSWNSNGSINHYINGLLNGTSNKTPYTTGGDTLIGTDNYVGDNGFNGSITEIIIYSNALSDSDRQKVESYLYWKWDTFTLDPSNPYTTQAYSNQASLYPKINSNLIPAVPRDLFLSFEKKPVLDSNNYPLIKNFIQLPNILKNIKF
jgi:hypothetical protein